MNRTRFAKRKGPSERQERYVFGLHAVSGWLERRPSEVRRILIVDSGRSRHQELIENAQARNIAQFSVAEQRLDELADGGRHQGVIAVLNPFPYADLKQTLDLDPRGPIVVLDGVQDPRNFGALLRSAAAVGVACVVIPKNGAVSITPIVEIAAAGATADLPVCRVANLSRALVQIKEKGYWVAALAAQGGTNLYEAELPDKIALVLGGERGLRRLTLKQSDYLVSIPMQGDVESLNVSVAAAVALFELFRRR